MHIKYNKNIIILIILIVFLSACDNNKSEAKIQNVFLNIRYTKKEIDLIYKYLEEDDIKYLEKNDYIDNIEEYISYENFDIKKFDRYSSFKTLHPDLDLYHIILYVNMNLDKEFYSVFDIVSNPNDILVLVNKYNKLPNNYIPNDLEKIEIGCTVKDEIYLRREVNQKFYEMCINMKSLNLNIKAISGYRTKEYQEKLFNDYISKDGIDMALKYSAKPRFSEHETGLSVDVMGSNKNYIKFHETDEYKYIQEHASDYGFIIRYENEFVTGYINEAWHLRYVGIEVANKLKKDNITLDEYIYLLNN